MKKFKITKKSVLFAANLICFTVLLSICLITLFFMRGDFSTIFNCAVRQVGFTISSLIVYYLSIIADSVSKKYKEQEEREKQEKELK